MLVSLSLIYLAFFILSILDSNFLYDMSEKYVAHHNLFLRCLTKRKSKRYNI